MLRRTPALLTKAEEYCRRIIESLNGGQQLCKQMMTDVSIYLPRIASTY
ncbi:MAG TPA: hypothetical protein VFS47_01185 [Steroidobacteraceae bacterium]|nr:hypothetical protein [Steroidobacteraceae bacterium]